MQGCFIPYLKKIKEHSMTHLFKWKYSNKCSYFSWNNPVFYNAHLIICNQKIRKYEAPKHKLEFLFTNIIYILLIIWNETHSLITEAYLNIFSTDNIVYSVKIWFCKCLTSSVCLPYFTQVKIELHELLGVYLVHNKPHFHVVGQKIGTMMRWWWGQQFELRCFSEELLQSNTVQIKHFTSTDRDKSSR